MICQFYGTPAPAGQRRQLASQAWTASCRASPGRIIDDLHFIDPRRKDGWTSATTSNGWPTSCP